MTQLTIEIIRALDPENMWDMVSAFPKHWNHAIKLTSEFKLHLDVSQIHNVVISGMGASSIGGDLARAYVEPFATINIETNRHYGIPKWVSEHTLFIASSYSGDTEETLQAFKEAEKRGAHIFCITSGGKLLEQALKKGYDHIKIPDGISTRAALAYFFIPQYRIFQKLGFIKEGDTELKNTADFLESQVEKFADFEENEALNLAGDIQDTLPIIYSDSQLMAPVNTRWCNQFEENAKTLAYSNFFPEMTHNEIVGWEQIGHLTGRLSVIMLEDADDDPRVIERMNITKELISEQVAGLYVLVTQGTNRLMRLFSLVQFADWTSLYLALLNNVDPTPVAKIDLLKKKLADE